MKYSFKELVDVTKLQELTDELYIAASIPSAIVTMDGEVVTGSGWQRICTDFHRQHPQIEKECIESDTKIRKQLDEGEPFAIYKCPRGLVDASSPIIIAGEHIANVFAGQVFLTTPDETTEQSFREQALKFGFDETEYIGAFREIPIFSQKKFKAALSFLSKLSEIIAEMGLTRLHELENTEMLRESEVKYRSFSEQSLVGIYLVQNGVFKYVNPKFAEIFGYTVEECLDNLPFQDLVYPDDIATVEEQVRKRTSGEIKSAQYTFRGIKKNGDIIYVEIFGSLISLSGESVVTGTLLDITERKQAEDALLKQQYFLQKAQEIGHIGTWELDNKKNKLLWTDENYKIFGLPIGTELTYEIFLNCVHPDDREYVDTEWKASFAGKPYDIEHRLLVDGKVKWVREKAELEFNEEGECIRGTGVTQDITDRKAIEKSLHESKLFLENISDIAYIANAKGNVSYINPAAEEIIGLTLQEIIGQPFLPLFTETDRQSLVDVYNRTLCGESLENTLTFNSGITCHFTSLPFKNNQGEIIGTFGVARDISDRLEAEKALAESEARLKKAQSVAKIGNWEYDISTGQVWGSEQAFQIYGIERTSQYLPLDIVETCIPDASKVNQALIDLIQKNKKYDIEFEIHREIDGKVRLIHSIAELVFDNEVPIKVLGIIHDVTEQKKLEIQLQQAQKMESIGTLAGGIAHDFNNILFPIVGNTEMLLEDVPDDSPLRNNLNGVYTAAMRAKELVKQILAFSRQDSNEIKLIKIQPVIEEALKLVRSTIPTSINIKQYIQPDPLVIKADPTKIHQVVMNLATNAYHAMEDTGGTLKVNLKQIELGEQDLIDPRMKPGTYACLTIADTGAGIDENVKGSIFDPFFTTKELGKGTGMGLSVVHGIVKTAGGGIQVHSEIGKGTEFHIYLPVAMNLSVPQDPPSANQTQGGTERILLVDDEEPIVLMEKQMLERLGYSVVSRTSSVEALEAFRTDPDKFDLVITDMAMPNMSGDKLASEMNKIRTDIPILLCTGFSEKIPEEKAKSMGIEGFLMKPIVKKDLSNMIREVLDQTKKG